MHEQPLLNFAMKLSRLRKRLRQWNWNVFGDINRKEEILLANIVTAQKELETGWNPEVAEVLQKCPMDLQDIILMKESTARYKARINLLKEGGRNSGVLSCVY